MRRGDKPLLALMTLILTLLAECGQAVCAAHLERGVEKATNRQRGKKMDGY